MKEITQKKRNPWAWVPTLYFAEGIPYVVVNTVAVILYKRLGISNTDIALFTGLLYLPWVIKPFWSPFVDLIKTKRWWVVLMQLFIAIGFLAVAFFIPLSFYFKATLLVFWLIAFSSATHDIAADGFYMLALDDGQQSFFVGIRSTFYRFASITGQGLLIILAGFLETSTGMEPMRFEIQSTNNIVQTTDWKSALSAVPGSGSEGTFIAFSGGEAAEAAVETVGENVSSAGEVAGLASNAAGKAESTFTGFPTEDSADVKDVSVSEAGEVAGVAGQAGGDTVSEAVGTAVEVASAAGESNGTFIAFPSQLQLNTGNISTDSLNRLKQFVISHNQENGFIHVDNVVSENGTESWWQKTVSKAWKVNISRPLGNWIRNSFGEKQEIVSSNVLTGNAGIVAIKLNQKPLAGEEFVLNTRMKSGDKSISLISGERLTFNENNWDKPAYMVVQLDKKLDDKTITTFEATSGNLQLAWSIVFYILAAFFIILCIYHNFILPRPSSDVAKDHSPKDIMKEFGRTFSTFFRKKQIIAALLFMLLYRLGEAMLVKMASPFLLDGREIGGLGLTTGQVGLVYGTVGVLCLTIGGIIGGFAINRKGLKYWLWPMALCITLPHLAYLFLSWYQPQSMLAINLAVAIEQFGYGFGYTAYMMYLIFFSQGEYKTAHYAICTGFMALGMMLPGMFAGWLQELIGYHNFFIFVMICAIPTLSIIPFLKVDSDFGKVKKIKEPQTEQVEAK